MSVSARRLRIGAVSAALVVAAPVLWNSTQGSVNAAHQPANKVAASGSTIERMRPGASGVVLTEVIKINNPTDLILSVSSECSILTEVRTADGSAEARGRVVMWLTINGKAVPVAQTPPGQPADNGEVVFCDRIHQQESNLTGDGQEGDEEDNFVRSYLKTRTANAFNWMALNVGSAYPALPGLGENIYKIELHARLEESTVVSSVAPPAGGTPSTARAEAGIGKRTLVLEPVKSANDEAVTELAE